MLNNKRTKITLEIDNISASWEVDSNECDIRTLLKAFKGLMVTHEFSDEGINEYFSDKINEYED